MKPYYLILLMMFLLCEDTHSQQSFTLDSSFGNNGTIIFHQFMKNEDGKSLITQSDGKLLVLSNEKISRFNKDGSPDISFSDHQALPYMINLPGDTSYGRLNNMASDENGNIFVSATAENYRVTAEKSWVYKYKPDGTADISFGSNGKVELSLDSFTTISCFDVDKNGSLIIFSHSSLNMDFDSRSASCIIKFDSKGDIESSFGDSGFYKLDSNVIFNKLKTLEDGTFIASGSLYINDYTESDAVLAKFKTDGVPDSSFGINGYRMDNFTGFDFWRTMTIQPDGKILCIINDKYSSLYRYNTDGSIDNNFGDKGKIETVINYDENSVYDYDFITSNVLIARDGKIITTGTTEQKFDAGTTDFYHKAAFARYNSDGSSDKSFGEEGEVISYPVSTEAGSPAGLMANSVVTDDGSIISCGTYDVYPASKILISKIKPDGRLDSSFNFTGLALYQYPDLTQPSFNRVNSRLLNNGQIIVFNDYSISVGTDDYSGTAMYRLNNDGGKDYSFDYDGCYETLSDDLQNSGFSGNNYYTYISHINTYTLHVNELIQNNNYGSQNVYFADSGISTLPFYLDQPTPIQILPDNKFLALGDYYTGYSDSAYSHRGERLIRFTSDGKVDSSFGINGLAEPNYPSNYFDADNPKLFLITHNGNIASLSHIYEPLFGAYTFGITLYNTDGSLNKNFGNNGSAVLMLNEFLNSNHILQNEILYATDDNKFLLGYGYRPGLYTHDYVFRIIKINEDASVDTSFDDDATSNSNFFSSTIDNPIGMIKELNGNILLHKLDPLNSKIIFLRLKSNGDIDSSFGINGVMDYAVSDEGLLEFGLQVLLQNDGKLILTTQYNNGALSVNGLVQRIHYEDMQPPGFEDFSAEKNENIVQLRWKPIDERGIDYFYIERSKDLIHWIILDSVKSDGLSIPHDYFDKDAAPYIGFNYYRIKAKSFYNQYSYTPVRNINFTGDTPIHSVLVYPNPVNTTAMIDYVLDKDDNISILLSDNKGRVVSILQNNQFQQAGNYSFQVVLPSSLQHGIYYIVISGSSGKTGHKIIIQ